MDGSLEEALNIAVDIDLHSRPRAVLVGLL
jgi:hypothetical protein